MQVAAEPKTIARRKSDAVAKRNSALNFNRPGNRLTTNPAKICKAMQRVGRPYIRKGK